MAFEAAKGLRTVRGGGRHALGRPTRRGRLGAVSPASTTLFKATLDILRRHVKKRDRV
jgi:hypothetical protein